MSPAQRPDDRSADRHRIGSSPEHSPLPWHLGPLAGFLLQSRGDTARTVRSLDPGARSFLGERAAARLRTGESWLEMLHPEDREAVTTTVQAAVRTGQGFQILYRLPSEGGTWRWCSESGATTGPTTDGSVDQNIHSVVLDVDESWRTLERTLEGDPARMALRAAARTSHEINNLLQSLTAFASELSTRPDPDDQRIASQLEDLVRKSVRFARETQSLALRHETRDDVGQTDLAATVLENRPLLEALLTSRIRLQIEAPPHVVLAPLDRTRLEQILMNLVTNAREALPAGGRCTIRVSSRPAEGLAILECVDDGDGIPETLREQIFDEHFSTKPAGLGSGLGLAIVREHLAACGGRIEVHSAPGAGARFHLEFPLLEPPTPQTGRD